MDGLKAARQVLSQAEERLRALVSDAAATGDYTTVVQIADWARSIAGLFKSTASAEVERQPSPKTPASSTSPKKQARPRPQAASHGGYPRFFRQGNQMIRVAWSKREKKEYIHKTPYPILKNLADALCRVGVEGRIFTTGDFLPMRDDEKNEVPAYQTYVGIALLKQAGLIDQHGRQGYSIPRLAQLKDALEAVWRKLPEQ